MKKLILFMIRKRLGLMKYEKFQFSNQKNKNIVYFFGSKWLWKKHINGLDMELSNVSLNYLLSKECIVRVFE